MLEKNEKNIQKFSDAHFHQFECTEKNCLDLFPNWYGCSCALSKQEWFFLEKNKMNNCFYSFGIHPQFVCLKNKDIIQENLDFLEKLCKNSSPLKLNAIGEIGYDYFTKEYKQNAFLQNEVFLQQMELAVKYNKTVIIHCRKANDKLFENVKYLKKVPAVLFHSFMGTYAEAESLIKKGINAYFSFGKQIINNNKKVIECVSNLPLKNLLLETDAPFQLLKNEEKTYLSDIKKIYEEAKKLRKENISDVEFSNILFENLLYLYHDSE